MKQRDKKITISEELLSEIRELDPNKLHSFEIEVGDVSREVVSEIVTSLKNCLESNLAKSLITITEIKIKEDRKQITCTLK